MNDSPASARLTTDLVWGGLALVGALSGFAAGELSAFPGASEATRAASRPHQGPSRALVPSPPAKFATGGGDAVAVTSATSRPSLRPGARALGPVDSAPSAPPPAPVRRPFLTDARPKPALAIHLDPMAEELLRTLIRIRGLEESYAPVRVLSDLADQAPLAAKRALLLALAAYFPQEHLWPHDLPTTREYVRARHLHHLQEPEDQERLSALNYAIYQAPPGALDFAWLARLSEAHALNGTFDHVLVRQAPERAASVFAAREGGLTYGQRFSVAKSLASRDPRRAAALALRFLSEEWDYRLLNLARRHDPALAEEFARRHQSDPRFRSARRLADLQESSDRCYDSQSLVDWYRHLALAERTWREVLPEGLSDLLELISWEGAWTPLQARITEILRASGDEDLAWNGFSESSPAGKVAALARAEVPLEGLARSYLQQAFAESPFAAHEQLDHFVVLVPRLPLPEALNYAALFQEQGAPEAARRVLDRTRARRIKGALALGEAKLALERGRAVREVLEHYAEEGWDED